mgnify:CR=1 FL=1
MKKVLRNFRELFNRHQRTLKIASLALLLFIPIELFVFSTKSASEDELYWKSFLAHNQISSVPIPRGLNFAGEKVPIYDFTVIESMERELLVNTYFHSQSLLMHKRANRWLPTISRVLKKYGVPDDFKYIALIESNLSNVVSPKGATGFWQILESTAKEYGLEINDEVDERYHVEKATEAASKYILNAYKTLGSWTLAAASYNIGIDGLKKQLEKQKSTSYYDLSLNDETARYVFRILAVKEIITNPKNYGFILRKKDLYPAINTKKIHIDSSITDFGDFAQKNNISYKILKYFNPWLKRPILTNKNKKTYFIDIPEAGFNDTYAAFLTTTDSTSDYSHPTPILDSLKAK